MITQVQDPPSYDKRKTVIGTAISCLWQYFHGVAVLIVVSLIISISIELIGMYTWWADQGSEHSYEMLRKELSYLQEGYFYRSILNPFAYFLPWLDSINAWFAPQYNVLKEFNSEFMVTENFMLNIGSLKTIALDVMQATWNISRVFFLRVIVCIYSLSLLFLLVIVAIIDGLVERTLRRYTAGRESAWLFHVNNRIARPWVIYFIMFLYLSAPVSVNPLWFFIPAYSLIGISTYMMGKWFKKYL